MITDKGYTRQTYSEILNNVIQGFEERFGADINTSPTSTFGILARYQAALLNEVEQKQEQVYNSAFITKASGISLDRLASNYGIYRIPEKVAMVTLQFTGKPQYTIKNDTNFQTSNGLIFTLSEDVKLDEKGCGYGLSYGHSSGSLYNVPSNTISHQMEPTDDIFSVNNTEAATGGADAETDISFRRRLLNASKGVNTATYNGLISSIQSIAGVSAVRIVKNHNSEIDEYGNPPYTVHFYILGGDDNEIAKAILNSIAFGINTYGKVKVLVEDDSHNKHEIMFDRPSSKIVYGKIRINKNDNFPIDGQTQVKSQIQEYIKTLGMGDTVRFSFMYKYIYDNVPGINYADIYIGTTNDENNLQSKDINMNSFEVPTYNTDAIRVEVE